MDEKRGHYQLLDNGVFIRLLLERPRLRASLERYEHLVTEENPLGEHKTLTVEGDAVSDSGPLTLGFIDRQGSVERYIGPLFVQISGHGPRATMWHWSESDHPADEGQGCLYCSIYLEDERMAWLWRQVVERPGAVVTAGFHAPFYQMGVEAAFGEVGDRRHLYLARDEGERGPRVELSNISLSVISGPADLQGEPLIDDQELSQAPLTAAAAAPGIRLLAVLLIACTAVIIWAILATR